MQLSDKDIDILTTPKIFYKGVIEDNLDPAKIGRVRVRVLGVHTHDLGDLPSDTLPWSPVIKSLDFGGFNSGMGISSVPSNGTWVWCFPDNGDINSFVVLGAISGITNAKQSGIGFTDPSGTYPKSEYLGKSDHNSLQVASYLNNHTIQTPGGQTIELNDAGHVKITHSAGSTITMNSDGSILVSSPSAVSITAPNTTINSNVQINGTVNTSSTLKTGGAIDSGGAIQVAGSVTASAYLIG